MAGISREHLNRIETGKVNLTDDMQDKLMEAVEKFNPDAPMFLLFDYVRIRSAHLQSGDNDIRIPAYGHDDIFPDTIYHLRHVPAYQFFTLHDTQL